MPIAVEFLKFYWKDCLYNYSCLPNGWSQVPISRVHKTKETNVALHMLGYVTSESEYFDDVLLVGNTLEDCDENVKSTVNIFDNLGFVVEHPTKSILEPVQNIVYLGVNIDFDTVKMSLTLTSERTRKKFIEEKGQ